MYKIHDFVIYGSTGVCEIVDITHPDFLDAKNEQLYYVLKPLYQDGKIYSPVESNVFMRPVISKDEAQRLIDAMPTLEIKTFTNHSVQLLAEAYRNVINTHDCSQLAALSMSLYQKKCLLTEQKGKLGQTDEKFMRHAENLLFGELAVALDIDKNDVQKYIKARLEADEEVAEVLQSEA